MTWNFRIVKTETADGPMWGVYEVYYDDNGKPTMRTENPVAFTSDAAPEEIMDDLTRALDTAVLHGPLDDSEISGVVG